MKKKKKSIKRKIPARYRKLYQTGGANGFSTDPQTPQMSFTDPSPTDGWMDTSATINGGVGNEATGGSMDAFKSAIPGAVSSIGGAIGDAVVDKNNPGTIREKPGYTTHEDEALTTRSKRLGHATTGLNAAAAAASVIPVFGTLASGILAGAGAITKAFSKKTAKDAFTQTRNDIHTSNPFGNVSQYGGKIYQGGGGWGTDPQMSFTQEVPEGGWMDTTGMSGTDPQMGMGTTGGNNWDGVKGAIPGAVSSIGNLIGDSIVDRNHPQLVDQEGYTIKEDKDLTQKANRLNNATTGINAAGDAAAMIPGYGALISGALKGVGALTSGLGKKAGREAFTQSKDNIYTTNPYGNIAQHGRPLGPENVDPDSLVMANAPNHNNPDSNNFKKTPNGEMVELQSKEISTPDWVFSGGDSERPPLGYDKKGEPTNDYKKVKVSFSDTVAKMKQTMKDKRDPFTKKTVMANVEGVKMDNQSVLPQAPQPMQAQYGASIPKAQTGIGMLDNYPTLDDYRTIQQESVMDYNMFPNDLYRPVFEQPSPLPFAAYDPFKLPKDTREWHPTGNDIENNEQRKYIADPEEKGGDDGGNNMNKNGMTPGTIATLSSYAAPTLYNLAMGLKKPDVADPNYNPHEGRIRSLMANLRWNNQATKNAINLQRNAYNRSVNNAVSGAGVRNSRMLAGFNTAANAMANAEMQGAVQNNQYRMAEANALNNLGQQRATEDTRVADVNAMNLARKREFLANAMKNINQAGVSTGQAMDQNLYNNQLSTVLNDLYRNFYMNDGKVTHRKQY